MTKHRPSNPFMDRTLKLGAAYENYLEEIDEEALYACEHNFVISEGDEFLCKDCDELFASHPADWINPIPVGDPVEKAKDSEYLFASGLVGVQGIYQFPVINAPPPQTISSFANFSKPLMRAIFPKEIADEL